MGDRMQGKRVGKTAVRMDSVLGGLPSQAAVGTTELKSKVSITSGRFFSESLGDKSALPPGAMLPVSPSPASNRPATSPRTTPRSRKDVSPSLPADSPRRLQPSDGRAGSVVIWGDGWGKSARNAEPIVGGNITVMSPTVPDSDGGGENGRGDQSPSFASPRVDVELNGKKMLYACGGFGEIALLLEGGELVVSGGGEQSWGGDTVQKPLRQVASGFQHTVFLTQAGELYSTGTNTFGQLGYTGEGVERIPRLIPAFANRQVAMVACGQYHTLCVTDGGEVLAWGRGTEGQLGLGHPTSVPVPRFVKALSGKFVDAIAAAWNVSCAVTAMGELMVWGDNSVGQLGLGKGTGRQASPVQVKLPPSPSPAADETPVVVSVDGGWGHTVAVTLDGAVFSWGFGGRGQLGHGDRESLWSPKRVQGLQGVDVRRVCCGAHFAIALTATGAVFVWGSGSHHRLGLGDDQDRLVPTESPLRGKEVTQVAVCENKVLAFAPIRLVEIAPDSTPLQGGTSLRIRGDGFFQASRVKARLDFTSFMGDEGESEGEIRLARGSFDEATGDVFVQTPSLDAPATCILELSFDNGETYTTSGLTLSFYNQPTLVSVTPSFRSTEGKMLLSLAGEGFENAGAYTTVRMTKNPVEGSNHKDIGEEESGLSDLLVRGTFNPSTGLLEFLSPPMSAGTATVRVALNGQQYTEEALTVQYFHPPKLLEVVPDCVPIAGGKLTISAENLLGNVLGRLRGGGLGADGVLLTVSSVEVDSGTAEFEAPADLPVGPSMLEISVDGGGAWSESSALSVYLFPPLAPSLPLRYAHRGGGSTQVIKDDALFPARGLTVTVGNVTVSAKFDLARGGVSCTVPPFDPAMPRGKPPPPPEGEEAEETEEEEGGPVYVPVTFSPDGRSSFPAGSMCYLPLFTFDSFKPPKSGKNAAQTAITITGTGFTDTERLLVRFEQEEAEPLFEEATFASETSVTVTSPEGLSAGPCQLALSLDGRDGIFEECATAFTVM